MACILIDSKEVPGVFLAALLQSIAVVQNEVLNDLISNISFGGSNNYLGDELMSRRRIQNAKKEDFLNLGDLDINQMISNLPIARDR